MASAGGADLSQDLDALVQWDPAVLPENRDADAAEHGRGVQHGEHNTATKGCTILVTNEMVLIIARLTPSTDVAVCGPFPQISFGPSLREDADNGRHDIANEQKDDGRAGRRH